jgi:hypothetical protein
MQSHSPESSENLITQLAEESVKNPAQDPIRKIRAITGNDTELLTGMNAIVRAGFALEANAILLEIMIKLGCSIGLRAGNPAILLHPTQPKPIWCKTKTFSLIFLSGLIPEDNLFRRTSEDHLPRIPDDVNAHYIPVPVRLRDILAHAQREDKKTNDEGNTPIYKILRFKNNKLVFKAINLNNKKIHDLFFCLDLSTEHKSEFNPSKKEADAIYPWAQIYTDPLYWSKQLNMEEAELIKLLDTFYIPSMKAPNEDPKTILALAVDNRLVTGDIDMCYLSVPIRIMKEGKEIPMPSVYIKTYHTYVSEKDKDNVLHVEFSDKEQIELMNAFLELYAIYFKPSISEQPPSDIIDNESHSFTKEVKEFIKTSGSITAYELLVAYLFNKEFRKKFSPDGNHKNSYFANFIQHGCETGNPNAPSSLNDTIHHVMTFTTFNQSPSDTINNEIKHLIALTFDENNLADAVAHLATLGQFVHIHSQWDMSIWARVIQIQIQNNMDRYIKPKTRANYENFLLAEKQKIPNIIKEKLSPVANSTLFKFFTPTLPLRPMRRNSFARAMNEQHSIIDEQQPIHSPNTAKNNLTDSTMLLIDECSNNNPNFITSLSQSMNNIYKSTLIEEKGSQKMPVDEEGIEMQSLLSASVQ